MLAPDADNDTELPTQMVDEGGLIDSIGKALIVIEVVAFDEHPFKLNPVTV